jgi:hypothetical protein
MDGSTTIVSQASDDQIELTISYHSTCVRNIVNCLEKWIYPR